MEFGWYEAVMLLLVVFAHLHGIYEGKKGALVAGAEATLKTLEKEGIIEVKENGEVIAVCKDC